MAVSWDPPDHGIEWGADLTPDPEDVRHRGSDLAAHHRPYVRCPCGCEDQRDDDAYDPPGRNLRGYEAVLFVEFRAVPP